ncbi:MAG TPA: glycosyltransferase [Methylocella sp.]|jgi:glycosyltransferase involved in cell wall biosynthesis
MTQAFRLPFQQGAAHPLAGAAVLQLVPDLDANFTAQAAIDIAAALDAAGARALIACAGGRMTGELQAKGGIFVPFPSRSKNPFAMALNARRLARLIATERADIVHVHSRALAWVAYGATRMTQTPLVTSFQSGGRGANPITLRYNSILARGDAVLADSYFSAELARKLHTPAAAKIRVVRQGVDCRIFAPGTVAPARVHDVRRGWKVAPHEQIVLLMAQTSHAGAPKLLIEAARLLTRSGLTGVKFILAYDGKAGAIARVIDKAIAKDGLQGIMYRVLSPDMPAAYLAASVVVVLPDGLQQPACDAAIQAQAMGTPVIAANTGAAPEIILAPPMVGESARTGFLIKPGDSAALAMAIAHVLNLGASAAGKLSSRARRHAEMHFSTEHICAETLEAYAALRCRSE